jgi:hypothetical protein
MSKPKQSEESSEAPPKRKGKPAFTTGSWIALGCFVPAAVLAWNVGRSWYAKKTVMGGKQNEVTTMMTRNDTLRPIYDVLQNRKFQIKNNTPLQVTVPWIASAYHDGKQVKLFDSSHCRDWQPLIIAAGDAKIVTLSSSQDGCNWNGAVMYYAMRLYRQIEDEKMIVDRPYDYIDMYKGYDRDTITIQ